MTTTGNSLQLVYVGMNVTVKPLDNVNVREALRTAIDYDGIVKDLFKGGAKKVQGIVPAGLAGYNETTPFQADVNKAKSLLQQAGQTAITLELLVPTGPAPGGVAWADLAAKLQSDWKNIGVTVNIKQTTQADLLGTYRAQKGQLVMILWGPDFPDPDANVGPRTTPPSRSPSATVGTTRRSLPRAAMPRSSPTRPSAPPHTRTSPTTCSTTGPTSCSTSRPNRSACARM